MTRAAEMLGAHEDTIRRHVTRAFEGDPTSRFDPGAIRRDWSGRWWIKRTEVERQIAPSDHDL